HADLVVTGNDPGELRSALADADVAILVRTGQVTSDVLRDASRLKAIATVSAGTEHVDLAACEARGIRVISGAGVNSGVVAEYVLGAIVAAHRDLLPLHMALMDDAWSWEDKVRRSGTARRGPGARRAEGCGHRRLQRGTATP